MAITVEKIKKWIEKDKIDKLIKALEHKKDTVRKEAVEALGKVGEPAVEKLFQCAYYRYAKIIVNAIQEKGWEPTKDILAARYILAKLDFDQDIAGDIYSNVLSGWSQRICYKNIENYKEYILPRLTDISDKRISQKYKEIFESIIKNALSDIRVISCSIPSKYNIPQKCVVCSSNQDLHLDKFDSSYNTTNSYATGDIITTHKSSFNLYFCKSCMEIKGHRTLASYWDSHSIEFYNVDYGYTFVKMNDCTSTYFIKELGDESSKQTSKLREYLIKKGKQDLTIGSFYEEEGF